MEAIRLEMSVRPDGSLLIPRLNAGEQIEVIVLRKEETTPPKRVAGWAKGYFEILPGFDGRIPGLEDYQ